MDHYETSFFGNESGKDEVICEMGESTRDSNWPFKVRFRHCKDKPLITMYFATFMEVYLLVQSINKSYEKLLVTKEG